MNYNFRDDSNFLGVESKRRDRINNQAPAAHTVD